MVEPMPTHKLIHLPVSAAKDGELKHVSIAREKAAFFAAIPALRNVHLAMDEVGISIK